MTQAKLTELAKQRRFALHARLREGVIDAHEVADLLGCTRQHANKLLWNLETARDIVVDHWRRRVPNGPPSPFFRYREGDEVSAPRPAPKPRTQIWKERYEKVHGDPKLHAKKLAVRKKRAAVRRKTDPEWVMAKRAREQARYARTKTVDQIDPLLAVFIK